MLLKFGPDSWRMHNEALSAFVTRLQEQLAAVKRQASAGRGGWLALELHTRGVGWEAYAGVAGKRQPAKPFASGHTPPARCSIGFAPMPPQVDTLNRERKLQQHAAGSELSKLEAEYLGLVHKVRLKTWFLSNMLVGEE